MKLQNWIVYKQIEDVKTNIGQVKTALDATRDIARQKAWVKFVGKTPFTIGWNLLVRKDKVVLI